MGKSTGRNITLKGTVSPIKDAKGNVIPNRWRLRVYVGTDAKGRPVFRSKNFQGTVRERDTEMRSLIEEASSGRSIDHDDATVADLFDRWLANVPHAPSTRQGYDSKIRTYLRPAFGAVKVMALRPEMIDRAYRGWEREGKAPATVLQCHRILGAAFHQAVRWGWVNGNPVALATPPSLHRPRLTAMPPSELAMILDAAIAKEGVGGVMPVAIGLGAVTGARRGELCALRWSDLGSAVGTADAEFAIARSLTRLIGQTPILGPTKTHAERSVAIGAAGRDILARRWEKQARYAEHARTALRPDAFVLSRSPDGSEPCLPDGLSHGFADLVEGLWPRPFRPNRKRVGKPRRHFHDLRHFCATEMVAAGIDVVSGAGRLGHKQVATFTDFYAAAKRDRDQAAARALASSLPAVWADGRSP